MVKRYLVLIILMINVNILMAQRTWFEIEVEKDIGDKLEVSFSPEIRFKEGMELNEYFFEPAVRYDFNDYFSLGANYRFGNNLNKDGESQWFGRYALDARTGYEWQHLTARFRMRFTNYEDFGGDDDEREKYLRFRLKLDYEIKKIDLTPYVLSELYRSITLKEFRKARWEGGMEYKINKFHDVGIYFRLNDYLYDKESVKIIGLTYKLSL